MAAKPDWTAQEIKEYFTFKVGLTTTDPNVVYFGELITLYNPNIKRETIEIIPEHSFLSPDLTLMMNPSLIKKIKPPGEN